MDADNDWTATGLFSPSKAKAHQAQAKDWAFVDSWLIKRYASKRLPAFERDEDTLQALLTLATFNDAADEQRSTTDRVEKAALQALTKRAETGTDDLCPLVTERISPKDGFYALAEIFVLLEASRMSATEIGTAIMDLNDALFAKKCEVHRTKSQLSALKAEQGRVTDVLTSLEEEVLKAPQNLPEQIAEWTRGTKHLRAKLAEYDDRLAAARSESKPCLTFDDVAKQATDLEERESHLARLESELKTYQSLPNDAKGARSKLEGAREELRQLTKRRDACFESLADT